MVPGETAFARMRIETCHGNPRCRDAQRLAALVCEADGTHLRLEVRLRDGLAQRRVAVGCMWHPWSMRSRRHIPG
jgi:hypothetical protein